MKTTQPIQVYSNNDYNDDNDSNNDNDNNRKQIMIMITTAITITITITITIAIMVVVVVVVVVVMMMGMVMMVMVVVVVVIVMMLMVMIIIMGIYHVHTYPAQGCSRRRVRQCILSLESSLMSLCKLATYVLPWNYEHFWQSSHCEGYCSTQLGLHVFSYVRAVVRGATRRSNGLILWPFWWSSCFIKRYFIALLWTPFCVSDAWSDFYMSMSSMSC